MKTRTETAISDHAVQSATGRTWSEWFDLLDTLVAGKTDPLRMARHLKFGHGLPTWWAQALSIRYHHERD